MIIAIFRMVVNQIARLFYANTIYGMLVGEDLQFDK